MIRDSKRVAQLIRNTEPFAAFKGSRKEWSRLLRTVLKPPGAVKFSK